MPNLIRAAVVVILVWTTMVQVTRCLAATPAGGFVSVDGTNLLDPDGRVLRLRGINLGWPVYISYEIDFPYGIEDDLDWAQTNALDKYLPPEQARRFFAMVKDRLIDAEDFRRIKGMGFNSVRAGFHFKEFGREVDGQPEPYHCLDKVILPGARRNGLVVAICLFAGNDLRPLFYQADAAGQAFRAEFTHRWVEIATRYRDDPAVAVYDLVNEPNTPDQPAAREGYNRWYRETIAAIRAVDSNHVIALEADHWAFPDAHCDNLRILREPVLLDEKVDPAHRLTWSLHVYKRANLRMGDGLQATSDAWAAVRQAQLQARVPIFVAEAGATEVQLPWLCENLDIFDRNGWSWMLWPWKEVRAGIFAPMHLTPTDIDSTPRGHSFYDLTEDLSLIVLCADPAEAIRKHSKAGEKSRQEFVGELGKRLARQGVRLDPALGDAALAEFLRNNFLPRLLPWRWSDAEFESAMNELRTENGINGHGWLAWDDLIATLRPHLTSAAGATQP